MNSGTDFSSLTSSRRTFLRQLAAGSTGLALGSLYRPGKALAAPKKSTVSVVTSTDQRDAAYKAMQPLEREIKRGIKDKQIVIKINSGQVDKKWWLNATDPKFVQGILDFLEPIYDRQVIVAESTAAGAQSTMVGFENYGFMYLKKQYNMKFADLNDGTATTKWILGQNRHPIPIDIIDTYLDPNVYLISATRLKTHNCVIATLSFKNIVMGSPINRYQQKQREGRNQKSLMHSGGNRGLSYNMFRLATLGVQPDLAVLDGVVGMEGKGPVWGTPVEQGIALASTDWVAADRIGVELMGMDYDEVKHLQWCAAAGMGTDDLDSIDIKGPDYRKHIITYKLHENIEEQREWIREDYSKK